MAYAAKGESLASLSPGWAKGTFHPVYLFAGPDTLQKDEAVAALKKHFLQGDDGGLNMDKLDGDSASAGEIIVAYQTLAFLGGKRLVLVRRAQELSAADAGKLAEALEKPSSAKGVGPGAERTANCLVLLWDEKPDGRNALVRAARAAGKEVVFWAPFENQMPAWVADRAKALGKTLRPEAARVLLETVGPNLPDLVQEIGKLASYVKDRPEITAADVEAMGGGNRALQYMEWDRALWSRDRTKALELLRMMAAQGQPPEALMSQTARAYQKVLAGKALKAEKVPIFEIFERLWIKTRGPQQALEAALDGYGWDELMGILENLAEAESELKTGRMDSDVGMTLLVRRLT